MKTRPKGPANLYVLLFLLAAAQLRADWRQFRGESGQGTEQINPPPELHINSLIWKVATPAGVASPIILADGGIVLAGAEGETVSVRVLNPENGALRWKYLVPSRRAEKTHPFTTLAAPTPVSDGKRIFAFFGGYGLLALNSQGEKLWDFSVSGLSNRHGFSSSPILVGELLYQSVECESGKSFLIALESSTGKTAWRKDRPLSRSGWSTPVFWTNSQRQELVLLGNKRVDSYDLRTGELLWWCGAMPADPVTTPATAGDLLIISWTGHGSQLEDGRIAMWKDIVHLDKNGDGKIQLSELTPDVGWKARAEIPDGTPENFFPAGDDFASADLDKDGFVNQEEWDGGIYAFLKDAPKNRVVAIKAGGKGDASAQIAWENGKGVSEMPSPIAFRDRVYTIKDGGILTCRDANTGKTHYEERLQAGGHYMASPIIAVSKDSALLLLCSGRGVLTALSEGQEFKVLSTLELGESIGATPALDAKHSRLYVRTEKHLYAFGPRIKAPK